jgi:hypothetical protein
LTAFAQRPVIPAISQLVQGLGVDNQWSNSLPAPISQLAMIDRSNLVNSKDLQKEVKLDCGLVQARVTLGGVKLVASWPETVASQLLVATTARPYAEKVLPWPPGELNQAWIAHPTRPNWTQLADRSKGRPDQCCRPPTPSNARATVDSFDQ